MSSSSKPEFNLAHIVGFSGASVVSLFLVSGVINLLALTGSFYMLQVYDRALTSRSIETLLALSILAVGLYLFQGILDVIRTQILVRVGARMDDRLAPLAHRVAIDMPRLGYSPAEATERGRDVDTMRQFVSSQAPIALLDLPWMPLYLAFVYVLHPTLAFVVLGGALVLGSLTLTTEVLSRRHSLVAQKEAVARAMITDSHIRNSEVLRAMGFTQRAVDRFDRANRAHLRSQMRSSDVGGTFGGVSKVLRMIVQSGVLGLGAYLVVQGEMSAGSIIAASVASARALAPIDLIINQWKAILGARRCYSRLKETLATLNQAKKSIALPAPKSSFSVEKVTVAVPGTGTVVLSDISFELQQGQALGLVGPSGSGKSSFARAATGIWPLLRGQVRLDTAALSQWDCDDLGRYVGYLPQDVSLLDGTVAENICRFETNGDGLQIIAASKMAGVHEMILRLPQGYETRLGINGSNISAGQRQRIALARALYGDPFLVVLDEPNSNLDADGEAALTKAIRSLRQKGSIVIVVSHRPSALAAVDMVGIMQVGRLEAFGPKDEIIARQMQPASRTPIVSTA